ncbi:MAG TPA: class III extradiol ring-cleavage dioxygenase [Anaeromyxobacteraceae bacterium]|nr:class III extradiol ring-cleavage dioxygenase [Anaeromyxobacteraceae bacterium]
MSAAPVLFVAHGAPTVALEGGPYAAALAALGASCPRPRALAVVSAHWTTDWTVGITSAERHRLIYDFGGFPEALYRLEYPAAGAPEVAARAAELLDAAGFHPRLDSVRGLDHGTWIPLRLAWPAADVPVVQIALPEVPAEALIRFGRALAPLRDEGVLLLASGGVVHNLGAVRFGDQGPVDHWARAFDEWISGRLEARDQEALVRWRELGPHADLAAPSTEHFDPLLVAVGAGREEDRLETVHRGFQHGNLSMRSVALR